MAAVTVAGACLCAQATAQPTAATTSATPPMGWNSWNSGIPLNERTVEQTVDAMVVSGMRDAGYRYVNLDAGWASPERDAAGDLQADPVKFPRGMKALASYVHSHGMYLGLYASPFDETCGQTPAIASAGHEVRDARTFARWGVDYLKYDWCRDEHNHAEQVRVFTAMRDALRHSGSQAGRRIFYSINPNNNSSALAQGTNYDWSGIADMARNNGDLMPLWHNGLPTVVLANGTSSREFGGVADQFAAAAPVARRSGPGHFNDPDMLIVGVQMAEMMGSHPRMLDTVLPKNIATSLANYIQPSPQQLAALRSIQFSPTPIEQRTNFSLWAMLAAPLIAGNDVRTMSPQVRAILTNREVIAVDQDRLVEQGTPVPGDPAVITKPLASGATAVALVNWGETAKTISISAARAGLRPAGCYMVRDLWTHTTTTTTGALTAAGIPAHGTTLLRVTPTGCR